MWLDDITEHYAETLARWRESFRTSAKLAAELGYDLRFRRMWELYLAYVEAGFRERADRRRADAAGQARVARAAVALSSAARG